MVSPIALLCGQRCRFLNFLHPLAETKGFVRPVSNGSLRLPQLLLQTLSRGFGTFSLGRRRTCVFSERSDRSELSAQRGNRTDNPMSPHAVELSTAERPVHRIGKHCGRRCLQRKPC